VSRFDATALPGRGDRVLVLGLGVSGEAAARHLLRLGATVTVSDAGDDPVLHERASSLDGAEALLGDADGSGAAAAAGTFDLVVASPGVPEKAPALAAAGRAGVEVWSEIELAFRLSSVPILGVTGTNGKTTATKMIADALGAAGFRVAAAGNIGRPLTDAAVEDHEVIVAELSSFQLRHIVSFRAPVGVVLNVAEDHLDWHGDFERYLAAKARLFENQLPGDVAIHHDDPDATRVVAGSAGRRVAFSAGAAPENGAGVDAHGVIVVPEGPVMKAASLKARGAPAILNAVASAAAACAFGAKPDAVGRALARFEPLPHRMELVGEVAGVSFVNDSKATNPHAVAAALDGLERVVLIAGGRNKGLDLRPIAAASGRVHAVVTLGESASDIEAAFAAAAPAVRVERASTMDDAVGRAAAVASLGDTVLLAPGCASFDMFTDYKARGEAFRSAVKRIEATSGGSPAREGGTA
jgi:UDP-N-acetylmuramoylalanine--D-glutamate ligase